MNLGVDNVVLAILVGVALLAAIILTRGRILRGPIPALRTVALVLAGAAVAGPTLGQPNPGLVILQDVSDSALQRPERLGTLPARARLEFAGQTGTAGTDRSSLEPERTNLANALQVASAYQPSRVLLVSDGNTTDGGDALQALPGVPVDVLPLPPRENTRIGELIAPNAIQPGSTVRAQAVLETTRASRVRVLPSLNGRPLPTQTVNLPVGRTTVPVEFSVTRPGELELEVRIQPDFEQPILDDARRLTVRSLEPAAALVIGDPAAARLLRAQGFNAREGTPADVREPFDAPLVVIRNGANNFSPAQLKLLEKYVLEGGGLMLTGGPASFGLGGWSRTPVENVAPVSMDLRTRVDVPLVAMVMVLDRSLSMVGGGGGLGGTKLALAIEGVGNVIELANERDYLGLITFSDTSDWVFKPMRASETNKLQMLRAAGNIEAQGGTILEPGYKEAIAALKESRAAIKHIILLTDGQLADTPDGRVPDFTGFARNARAAGITTSSIGVGGDADETRLRGIARAGGGRYYAALDVDTLPRIFTTEALTATRSLVRTEGVKPTLIRHPLSGGVRVAPPRLSAYVATTLKPQAEPILMGLDREPVLAVTRKGLGRSVALTADLNRSDTFTTWNELPALLGAVARWLEVAPTPFNLSISADGRTATVDAIDRNRYLNDERLELRVGDARLEMVQTAPGRYQAKLPSSATGNAILVRSGVALTRTRLEPQSRELDASGGSDTLRRIANASGGQVLETLEGYEAARAFTRVPLAPWLAMLAALVLVAELAWRRFRV